MTKRRLTAKERAEELVAWMTELGGEITIGLALAQFKRALQAHATAALNRHRRRCR